MTIISDDPNQLFAIFCVLYLASQFDSTFFRLTNVIIVNY